ncbi:MAG: acyl-CoA thioesterase domain-containing protein [Myxococcota bacterium]|nr:acyl-CoA thioesterase domain-containing protein [Myxococcota bacterium]
MPEAAIYRRDGDVFHPSPWAGSPWSERLQHGGPVNALFARMAERAAAETQLQLVRLTVDLFRPIPMEPLACRWRFLRRGRRIANVEIELLSGSGASPDPGQIEAPAAISRATAVLLLRRPELAASWQAEPDPPPPQDDANPIEFMPRAMRDQLPPGFHWSLRVSVGRDAQGPFAWVTTPLRLVEGEEMTPLQRCAAVADLTFGLSGRALLKGGQLEPDPDRVALINTDTTLYWARAPRGNRFAFRSPRISDEAGIGLAEVVLYDASGRLGRSTQSLVANPGAWNG